MGRGSSGAGARAKGARASKGAGGGGSGGASGSTTGGGLSPSAAKVRFARDTSPADRQAATKEFQRLFGEKFTLQDFASAVGAPSGSRVTIDYVPPETNNPRLGQAIETGKFRVYVTSKEFKSMERTFFRDSNGRNIIKNEEFIVKKAFRGTDVAPRAFASQVANASALGFSAIKTDAARGDGYNGYYTWARYGYNAKLKPYDRDHLPANLKGARTTHELFKTQAGRDWWRANGDTTKMRFNLAPGSRSQRILKAYIQERGL